MKSQIQILIAQDQINKAFDLLFVFSEEEEQQRILIALRSRYSNLKSHFHQELISWEQFVISRNKIIESLLDLAEELPEDAVEELAEKLPAKAPQTKPALRIYVPEESTPSGLPQTQRIILKRKPLLMTYVAVFLIAVGSTYFLEVFQPQPSIDHLYASYYSSFQYPIFRNSESQHFSTAKSEEAILREIQLAYNAGEFEKCMLFLEDLEKRTAACNPDMQFMKACIFLETKRMREAIEALRKLLELEQLIYKDTVEWYLALAYLYNREINKSKEQLMFIFGEHRHPYNEKAEKLYLEISKL